MSNLAQENRELRKRLEELEAEAGVEDLARLREQALEAERLRQDLASRERELERLTRERQELTGDPGSAPEGQVRYFSDISSYRVTFPFRKPVLQAQADGTNARVMQPNNTAEFRPLPGNWAGSIYDTADPQEIAHLDSLVRISPYVFRHGTRSCPKPRRKSGPPAAFVDAPATR